MVWIGLIWLRIDFGGGIESSGCMKGGNFFDWLNNDQRFKDDYVLLS